MPAIRPLVLAIERGRAYGGAHPIARRALADALTALGPVLARRGTLTLHVARHELLVDDDTLNAATPAAGELAARLFRRGVGALTLQAGLPADALAAFIAWLAGDARRDGEPSDVPPPSVTGISVALLRYDHLALADAPGAAAAALASCWAALARLAGVAAGDGDAARAPDAPRHAAHAPDHDDDDLHQARIVAALRAPTITVEQASAAAGAIGTLAEQGAYAPAPMRAQVGLRCHELLRRLGAPAFATLVRTLPASAPRRRVLVPLAQVLPAAALPAWLQVVAHALGATAPDGVQRLVAGHAAHAGDDPVRDRALRDVVAGCVEAWTRDGDDDERAPDAPDRLVRLALEAGHVDARVRAACDRLAADGALPRLLAWLDEAGDDATTRALRAHLGGDDTLRAQLLAEPVDAAAATALLARCDATRAPLLLDLLAAAGDRTARRLVLERLQALGDAVVPAVLARLADAPWFLARNLLALLRDAAGATRALDAHAAMLGRFLLDPAPQVRAEAVPLLVALPATRTSALARALGDADAQVVRVALGAMVDLGDALRTPGDDAAMRPVSAQLERIALGTHPDRGAHDARVQATAVWALAALGGTAVRDWLLARVVRRSRVLGRLQLAEPVPAAVAALHALRRDWRHDPVAQPALALAQREARDARWAAPLVDRLTEARA